MTTVRLPVEFEQKLEAVSRMRHRSKSDLIKEALGNFLFREEGRKDSYETGKEYFGKYGSGDGKLSVNRKKIVAEKLHAKYRAD
jgi:Arc/MetJ-type ribon-helix-helix transcriptional regulator